MNLPLEDYLAEQEDTRSVERERLWENALIDPERFLAYCIKTRHWEEFDGFFDMLERESEAQDSLSESDMFRHEWVLGDEENEWRLQHDC